MLTASLCFTQGVMVKGCVRLQSSAMFYDMCTRSRFWTESSELEVQYNDTHVYLFRLLDVAVGNSLLASSNNNRHAE